MLSDILQYTAEVVGVQPTDDTKRAQLLRWINRAAREIYYSGDLPNSVGDSQFSFDSLDTLQITLPWYVKQIRAARYADYGSKIELQSIQGRYKVFPWKPPYLSWRLMRATPLERSLSQASQLRFVIAVAETSPINITVVGQTAFAAKTNETVTIDAGQTEVTTTNQWLQDEPFGLESVQKDRVTNSDIVFSTTVDNVVVGRIPNRLLESYNQVLRLTEDDTTNFFDQGVEILYKIRMLPLLLNSDIFISSDYDDVLVWKVREHWYSTKDDQEKKVSFASAKCAKLIKDLSHSQESGLSINVGAAPSPYTQAASMYAKVP